MMMAHADGDGQKGDWEGAEDRWEQRRTLDIYEALA